MFRKPWLYIIGTIGAVILFFAFGVFQAGGDGDTARTFLAHAAAGESAEAHALIHTSLHEEFSQDDLAAMFADVATYAEVSFPSIGFSTENGIRQSTVTGSGVTAGGCESEMEFRFLNGGIVGFDIEPLCRRQ